MKIDKNMLIGLPIRDKVYLTVNADKNAQVISRDSGVPNQRVNDIKHEKTPFDNISGRNIEKLERTFNKYLFQNKISFEKDKNIVNQKSVSKDNLVNFICGMVRHTTGINEHELIFKGSEQDFLDKYSSQVKKELERDNHDFNIYIREDKNSSVYVFYEDFRVVITVNPRKKDKVYVYINLKETRVPRVALREDIG